ncbi:MAG TPA: NAD(P)-dependent oxidoreductase, partial [Nitrospinaceae bacterium]|nr:NAD(P)-dependent oxidoreductase [Nitrospinaceae bacterium]
MKILVTGAAGYIGSVLVPLLLKKGHEIIAIDNFMYKQTSLLGCCYSDKFSLINGDVRNTELVEKYLKKVDAVLPLACLTGAPLCDKDPITARSVNFEAIKSILEKRSPNQIIIFPTTNSGYGIGEKGIQCTEDTPLRPVSLYGQLKV